MPRVFSGIKPTGDMHLGNYIGAVSRWVSDQESNDALFCVVDLHTLTMPWDPAELTARTREVATLLMAAGLDPERCTLFVQSHVHEHAILTWLLNNVTQYGELQRMTQWKDKSKGGDSLSVGFFDYPVLMASDIVLYDTDEVPVGDDQRQHVELTRDIAQRFNHRFGETFVLPKATYPPAGARVMDLQNPQKKMSKSEDSPEGTVLVLDDPKVVAKKIKRAVTDSGSEVRYDPDEKPGVSNLLELHAALSGGTIAGSEQEFSGLQYGALKTAVAEVTVEALRPVRERYAELASDPAELDRLLAIGASKARSIAGPVVERAYRHAGLLLPGGTGAAPR